MMYSILSATENDFYAMPLPFSVYSWVKLGFTPIVFIPKGNNPKLELAKSYCGKSLFLTFECEEKRIPTYSQVIRLFGSTALSQWNDPGTLLITGDSDMCVFSDFFGSLNDGNIHIVGNDLTPTDQYPMCYAAMPVILWHLAMNVGDRSYQQCISELIDPIEGTNIRGEQWSYDQSHLKRMLEPFKAKIIFHTRSNGQNQYAQNRADRDGWDFDPAELIDAHLPRPLTDESNFQKVVDLFSVKYPEDDLSWMHLFRNEYIKLL